MKKLLAEAVRLSPFCISQKLVQRCLSDDGSNPISTSKDCRIDTLMHKATIVAF